MSADQVSKASLFALPSQWVPEIPADGGNEALLTLARGVCVFVVCIVFARAVVT
jgi:hypothetical protein